MVWINVDLFFMGVIGVYLWVGFIIGDYEEVGIKCVLMVRVVEIVVMVFWEKFNVVLVFVIGELSFVSMLIVDGEFDVVLC